jgi:16S rRNA processing protein RimM
MALVDLGRFGRAHGVRGALRFWAHNPKSELIAQGREILVGRTPETAKLLMVERVRFDAKGSVIEFKGISDRDQASSLTGANWYEPRERFPEAGADEVYLVDLIGLPVKTSAGRALGRVADVIEAGGGDVLVIRDGRAQYMVPLVDDFVTRIETGAQGEVVIEPIDGLLGDAP